MDLIRALGITGYSLATSTKVGDLWIRPRELQSHLSRYAQRFVSHTDDDVYQLQHLGSATCIRFRNRYFMISTEHQRKLGTDGRLGILSEAGNSVVTPHTMWFIESTQLGLNDDRLDFVVYEYRPEDYRNQAFSSQFFELDKNYGVKPNSDGLSLVIGYPTELQNIDYFSGRIDLLMVSSFVELLGKTSSQDVFEFKTIDKSRFIQDGTSGSPLFNICQNDEFFYVNWLGIVIRGGYRSRFGRVINSDFIIRQIERVAF